MLMGRTPELQSIVLLYLLHVEVDIVKCGSELTLNTATLCPEKQRTTIFCA